MAQFFSKFKKFFLGLISFSEKEKSGFNNGQESTELDKKLVFSLSKSRWPSFKQLKYIKKYLSRGERLAVGGCLLIIALCSLFLTVRFYKNHLEARPVVGGDYVEGMVGSIKYVNPLYSAVSDADSDLAGLVYSSLFRRGQDGQLNKDLAVNYSASADGKSYTISVRNDARWHNGSLVTVDDVIFTFQAIKNSQYKSPLRVSFTGVEIQRIDDQTIRFNLAEPYAAFLDLLAFGILPQELWQQIEPAAASLAELNIKPIGSGRYKFKSFVKDKSGNIRVYNLTRNVDYYEQPAYINNLSFKIFGSVAEGVSALNNNSISGLSYLPEDAKNDVVAQDSLNFHQLKLPKLSAIFFNVKSNPALADKKIRQALAYALDKTRIINEVRGGNAQLVESPILPDNFAYDLNSKKYGRDLATSSRLLSEAGWKIIELKDQDIEQAEDDLSSQEEDVKKAAQAKIEMGPGRWLIKDNSFLLIKLTTVDIPEYSQAANLIAGFWQSVNVKTTINLVSASQMQTDILKPRNFNALLYGEIVGADPDPYPFWHSTQIGQAGLNLADYDNKEADKLLEEGRLTNDLKTRGEKYKKFQEIIIEDAPAIFLYSPYYTYLQSKSVKGFNVKSIIMPSDRFADINQWYVKTGKKIVW